MSTGDWRAPVHDGYLLPQLCWFSVPTAESIGGDVNGRLHTLQGFLNIAHNAQMIAMATVTREQLHRGQIGGM